MTARPAIAATLDAVGFACPLPVLKARRALAALAPGEVLEILADDPGTGPDLEALCRMTGDRVIAQSSAAGIDRFLVEKSAPAR